MERYINFSMCIFILSIFISIGPVCASHIGIIEVPTSDVLNARQSLDVKQEIENRDLADMQDTKKVSGVSSYTPPEHLSDVLYEEIYQNDCDSSLPFMPPEGYVEHVDERTYVKDPQILFLNPQPLDFPRTLYEPAHNVMDDSNTYGLDSNDLLYAYIRKQRSEEDFLEQLEHDAIISNMLPTMDEPFFRDANFYPVPRVPIPTSKLEMPSVPMPQSNMLAYFPKSYETPLLFQLRVSCTPQIHGVSDENFKIPLPYHTYAETYLQGLENKYEGK